MPRNHIPRFRHCLFLAMLFAALSVSLRFGFLGAQPQAAPVITFIVTNTNDAGAGSLRQAILDANAIAGPDNIGFNIGSGPRRIVVTSLLPTITDPLTIDGTTQPGFAGTPLIEIQPDGQVIGDGFTITAGNSVLRGLVLNKFRGHAIKIENGGGNVIEGNYIGTEANGSVASANLQSGVFIVSSSNNRIGGLTVAARNVISGNLGNGVHIATGASNNTVQGNYIGVNVAGTAALGNQSGVAFFNNAHHNTVGGTTAAARNVISGNRSNGIQIEGADSNVVQGNYVGTNAAGDAAINNTSDEIRAVGSNNTLIGGPTSIPGTAPGNVVVNMFIAGSSESVVQGNLIGTNAAGTARLNNFGLGMVVWGPATIGGSTPGTGNVISGFRIGVFVANSGGGSILGNRIGTDITGTNAIPNVVGVQLTGNVKDTRVGGTAAAEANVISGNGTGIQLLANNGIIKGNFIGTRSDGTTPLPNTTDGIEIQEHSSENIIGGGTEQGAANTIAFNGRHGISITPTGTNFVSTKNTIRGNIIHSNGGLGIDLGGDQVTLNDFGDGDTGPNGTQNYPEVLSVTAGASAVIQGALNSVASSAFTLDFYVSSSCDQSGFGEGASLIGSTQVNTDTLGNSNFSVQFPVSIPTGSVVTATATDSNGNTSEFSLCYVVNGPGTVQFTSSVAATEQAGLVTFLVSRTRGTVDGGTVSFATSNGTATAGSDYTETSGTLTFTQGQTIKTLRVPVIDDALDENSETVNLTLSNPTGFTLGSKNTASLTILDNDPSPTISVDDVTVGEGDSGFTEAQIMLRLSAPSGRTVSVRFATFGGSASPGVDFENVFNLTVTFNPGEATKAVPVRILGDTFLEPDEVFFANLTLPSNATLPDNFVEARIIDDDSLILIAEPNSDHAISLDSVLLLTDPFPVLNSLNFSNDHRTRIMLFATGVKLGPGEGASNISAIAEDSQGGMHPLTVEFVGTVPSLNWLTEIVLKLPDSLTNANTALVSITLHGSSSNKVRIGIKTP